MDSETLCNQAFLDLLPALKEPVESLVDEFRGKKLADILGDIEHKVSSPLPEGFEHRYRMRVAELFATQLRPVAGVPEMLAAIEFPCCIASSGPLEKIKQALTVTGLARYFDERFFSSYIVGSWKPDPGLFLYAAAAMGFSPAHCVVVEDSPVGIEAAASAGMRALHYAPSAKTSGDTNTFSSMSALPAILKGLEAANV